LLGKAPHLVTLSRHLTNFPLKAWSRHILTLVLALKRLEGRPRLHYAALRFMRPLRFPHA
jgi:hypothetical protein